MEFESDLDTYFVNGFLSHQVGGFSPFCCFSFLILTLSFGICLDWKEAISQDIKSNARIPYPFHLYLYLAERSQLITARGLYEIQRIIINPSIFFNDY